MTPPRSALGSAAPAGNVSPWEILEQDHRSLNNLLSRTRRAIGTDELDGLRARLVHRLGCHLDLEEQAIFPILMATSAGAAREAIDLLYEEHGAIREALDAFRTARPEQAGSTFDLMRERLRMHQARERRVLYPVSQELCPPALGQALANKIRECRERHR